MKGCRGRRSSSKGPHLEDLFSQARSVYPGMELDTKHTTLAMSCVFFACFGVLVVCCSLVSSTESECGSQCSYLVSLVRYLTEKGQRLRSSWVHLQPEILPKSVGRHDLPSAEALLYLVLRQSGQRRCNHADKHVSLTLAKADTPQAPR